MKTKVLTHRFYCSHMKSPKGRGGWLFENKDGEVVFSFSGTYTEAKRAAEATSFGVLFVCP